MRSRSKRANPFGAAVLGMAMFATACGGSATVDETTTAVSDAPVTDGVAEVVEESAGGLGLPELIGTTVSGGQLDTNDLAGQDVVVWFWAPW